MNAALASLLEVTRPFIVLAMTASLITYILVLFFEKRLRDGQSRGRLRLAVSTAIVLVLALLAHWLQFKLLNIPLPLDRTSLFIVPLLMVTCGAVLTIAAASRISYYVRLAGVFVLTTSAVYFLGALRDSYFQEWKWYGADAKSAFTIIVEASRRAGLREVPVDWKYAPGLNFYRTINGTKDVQRFFGFDLDTIPPDKALYVLPLNQYETFVRSSRLRIIYRGPIAGMLVAESNHGAPQQVSAPHPLH